MDQRILTSIGRTQQSVEALHGGRRADSVAGWTEAQFDVWTYASATTVTTPGDATGKYGLGDKIRFKQGGAYQYGYLSAAPSYNAGTELTTLTMQMCSGSALANAAITDNAYSKAATPQDFPDNSLSTTTLMATATVTTNTTLGSGHYTVRCNAAGGAITITLPAAASCAGRVYNVKKIDASANVVVVDGDSSETIDGQTTQTLGSQYDNLTIQSNGTGWDIL